MTTSRSSPTPGRSCFSTIPAGLVSGGGNGGARQAMYDARPQSVNSAGRYGISHHQHLQQQQQQQHYTFQSDHMTFYDDNNRGYAGSLQQQQQQSRSPTLLKMSSTATVCHNDTNNNQIGLSSSTSPASPSSAAAAGGSSYHQQYVPSQRYPSAVPSPLNSIFIDDSQPLSQQQGYINNQYGLAASQRYGSSGEVVSTATSATATATAASYKPEMM